MMIQPDTPQRVIEMLTREENFIPVANKLADVQVLIRAKAQA
jgi:hypothetical protein